MATKFQGVRKIWLYLYLGCNSVTWHAVCRYPDKTEGNLHLHSRERVAASVQLEYSFRHVVYGKTEIVVQNLSHYTQYSISVEACREIVPEEPNNTTQNCSQKSFQTGRTLSLGKSVTFTRQASWFSSDFGVDHFKFLPGNSPSWVKFFIGLLSSSRWIVGSYLDLGPISSFQSHASLSFRKSLTMWHNMVWKTS